MDIKNEIETIIKNAIEKSGYKLEEVTIESPKEKSNGDFSCNAAMRIAKELKQNPKDVANIILKNIESNELIETIEIAGPGFININIYKNALLKGINDILNQNENYGKSIIGEGKKINVEFVSANPTGILHLGTARGAAYGDNICRILKFAGYDVTREYYINDAGNQIKNLGLSIKTRYENICGTQSEMPKDGYFGKEIITIAEQLYKEENSNQLNAQSEYFEKLGVSKLLEIIKQDLAAFRVSFDVWSSEKKIRESGKIEESLKMLKDEGNTYEKDGATWLLTTKYGDDKDRVIIKQDGEYTYLVPDIAYHLDKINRGYDLLIDVLGSDHHGYVSRLKAAIESLGFEKEKIEIKLLQMVKLIRDGEEVKMSKRTGNTVTIRELMEDVGTDAARYFFAMRSLDTQMDFDMTLATKKTSENPVYYVQYAHARICSILKDTESKEIKEYKTINSSYAYDLLNKVYDFKDIVESAAKKQMPHVITNYIYELATLFHVFYTKEKVLNEEDIIYTSERLNLIKCVKITINNALNLLGVEAPEKM